MGKNELLASKNHIYGLIYNYLVNQHNKSIAEKTGPSRLVSDYEVQSKIILEEIFESVDAYVDSRIELALNKNNAEIMSLLDKIYR